MGYKKLRLQECKNRLIFTENVNGHNKPLTDKKTMKKYRCTVCDWVYDPALGDPDNGIAPGTPFESLPDDWACPLCGVGKDEFEVVE